MVAPAIGSVVLVPFPFSNLSQSKLRPAVCLADAGRRDWVLCQITSNRYGAFARVLSALACLVGGHGLELLGNDVPTAYDGIEAVEATGRFRPEVVLMDVGMPRLNGREAARRIRDRPWGRAPVIIALTGWGQENDRERSREAGCDGHLVKPVDLRDLRKLVGDRKSVV